MKVVYVWLSNAILKMSIDSAEIDGFVESCAGLKEAIISESTIICSIMQYAIIAHYCHALKGYFYSKSLI